MTIFFSRKYSLCFFVLLILMQPVFSDDGYYGGSGSSVFPLKNEDIRMEDETVLLKVKENKIDVECEFVFVNEGPETEIQMGFPDTGVEDDRPPDEDRLSIRDFKIYENGKELQYQIADATVTDSWNTNFHQDLTQKVHLSIYKVFLWKSHFKPHERKVYTHTYSMGISGDSSGYIYVDYVLTTGSLWKGNIGHAKIILDYNEFGGKFEEASPAGYTVNFKDKEIIWDLSDFEPDSDVRVTIINPMNFALDYPYRYYHEDGHFDSYFDMKFPQYHKWFEADFKKCEDFEKEITDFSKEQEEEDLLLGERLAKHNKGVIKEYSTKVGLRMAGNTNYKHTKYQEISSSFTSQVEINGHQYSPTSFAVFPAENKLFLLDLASYQVKIFKNGNLIQIINLPEKPDMETLANFTKNRPYPWLKDIAIDSEQNVYILDVLKQRVIRLHKKTKYSDYSFITFPDKLDPFFAWLYINNGKLGVTGYLTNYQTSLEICDKDVSSDKVKKVPFISTSLGDLKQVTRRNHLYISYEHENPTGMLTISPPFHNCGVMYPHKTNNLIFSLFPCNSLVLVTNDTGKNIMILELSGLTGRPMVDQNGNIYYLRKTQTGISINKFELTQKPDYTTCCSEACNENSKMNFLRFLPQNHDLDSPYYWDKYFVGLGDHFGLRHNYNLEEKDNLKKVSRLIRNEIFARHGYVFSDPELKNYFKRSSWYKENINFSAEELNPVEKINIEKLKLFEQRLEIVKTSQDLMNTLFQLSKEWAL